MSDEYFRVEKRRIELRYVDMELFDLFLIVDVWMIGFVVVSYYVI